MKRVALHFVLIAALIALCWWLSLALRPHGMQLVGMGLLAGVGISAIESLVSRRRGW